MPNDCKPKRRNDIEALIARAGGDDHIRREFVGMTGDIGGPGNNIDSRRATGQPPGETVGRIGLATLEQLGERQFIDKRLAVELPTAADELADLRSEEHTSELQSLMRLSYAVFCLKQKN